MENQTLKSSILLPLHQAITFSISPSATEYFTARSLLSLGNVKLLVPHRNTDNLTATSQRDKIGWRFSLYNSDLIRQTGTAQRPLLFQTIGSLVSSDYVITITCYCPDLVLLGLWLVIIHSHRHLRYPIWCKHVTWSLKIKHECLSKIRLSH